MVRLLFNIDGGLFIIMYALVRVDKVRLYKLIRHVILKEVDFP
jgi:hypothetical protein